jgi:hypothetical protein
MADEAAPQSSIVLYQTEDGKTRVECRFEDQNLWMTQAQISELFQTTVANINAHLKAIYEDKELPETATIKSYLIVRNEGNRRVSRDVLHYSLPAILAVGFRVRSARGTQFRQWATARLGEYLVKGFTMDDERLKNPPGAGAPDYFDELLERIRDIRASERRMYLRLKDILALAADYSTADAEAQVFFQTVQNKLHFAVTGKTAAELIAARADGGEANMGLTSWKGGRVVKSDVTVAKNYLKENEIGELNRIVTMFLDFAEDQAGRKKQIFLRDWRERLDDFLRFNERNVLAGAGRVSREDAERRAQTEYERFAARRRETLEAEGEAEIGRELEAEVKRTRRDRKKGEQ